MYDEIVLAALYSVGSIALAMTGYTLAKHLFGIDVDT